MSENDFPILSKGIYANHAAIAPWPRVTAEAVSNFAQENLLEGPANYREWIRREHELRGQLAELIGAPEARDIALMKNTTEGICCVAYGFPWERGDNIVIPAGEFPSNRLPWLAQETLGVEVRQVDIRRSDAPETALLDAMDERTRVVAVSSVQFSDGFRLHLPTLGHACKTGDVLFFVVAIQHLGALPIDVEACHIDCLAADAHKWLLGPEGIAVFYCRETARSKLRLLQSGWHMFDNPWHFERNDWTPSRSARRFEAGSPNSLGQAALHATLSFLLETGIKPISERILSNTRTLFQGLSTLASVSLVSSQEPPRHSGIVSFRVGDTEPREIYKRLMTAGVTCALREGNIRLSPHFYQDEAVMGRLLNAVEDAL
jgi:selenocysteine lyase/cysteine desulfurase